MQEYKKKICVLGLGYIGLPTSAVLANYGFSVTGVDVKPEVVNGLNEGLVHQALRSKTFRASTKVTEADVYLIAVPTPISQKHEADLTYVLQAVDMIIPTLSPTSLVLLESTVPVGTTESVTSRILASRKELEGKISVAYCPERVLPGQILYELINNDRIVGGINLSSTEQAAKFYRSFVKGSVLETDSKTAEFCKLSENAYRDVNIAFANELSMICERHDVSAWEVIQFSNRHPRVNILQPSCGVGGHCIAVDPWFLHEAAPDLATLIKESRSVNLRKTQWVCQKLLKEVRIWEKKHGVAPSVTCLGLTFKADVDDVRDSPALEIAMSINNQINKLLVVDPHVKKMDGLQMVNLSAGLERADIVVILVKHREFTKIDPKATQILDFCNAVTT